ncbi:MIP/aquaporin family protein [Longimicrobium sp.]|uniref:MIP/aquaporin family protein n=1 Tax=Longimicrobium sp. TaxID=2029185 RepID=UPI003B3A6961
MRDTPSRALTAEAIGTFALCFVGILAINVDAISGGEGAASLASIAFAHGLTIMVMVAALGAISGAHFNPAVTIGFVATGRMTAVRGVQYAVAQLAGAVLASLLVAWLFGLDVVRGGTPAVAPMVKPVGAMVVEVVTTFFLVLVVFGTAVDHRAPRSVFPFAIGLTVALDIMATGPITGAAMNPARALGPALVSGAWANHWVYWAGPLLGGVLAAFLQHRFLMEHAPSPATAEHGGPAPAEERGV